jgi:hypothetical protein
MEAMGADSLMWSRLDDQAPLHPKWMALARDWQTWAAAKALWVDGLAYCNRYLTDGLIPQAWVYSNTPMPRETALAAAEALVSVNLWERASNGDYIVHDFLDYNPSRQEVLEKRAKDAARKAAASKRTPRRFTDDSADIPDETPRGIHAESARTPTPPDPDPDPLPRSESDARAPELAPLGITAAALHQHHDQGAMAVAAKHGEHWRSAQTAGVGNWAKAIKLGYTREQLEHAIDMGLAEADECGPSTARGFSSAL